MILRISSVALLLAAATAPLGAAENPRTGRADPRLRSFDRLMRRMFRRHGIPGASLAVSRGGRLACARGYGYADVDAKQPVRPTSLFRIASISKPVTAVAILQLAQRGTISLDDKVVDLLPKVSLSVDIVDGRINDITVLHLLYHSGGWDRNEAKFDPMFASVKIAEQQGVPSPPGPGDIIRYMFEQRLDFPPGGRFAYSNLGYCLLGRIIEQASGKSYEDYVQAEVLAPLGITAMRLGKTLPDQRAPGEVVYYHKKEPTGPSVFASNLGEQVPTPYGVFCLEAMDAHGGWLASSVDLVRFADAFNDPDHCPILNAKSVRFMFRRPPGRLGFDEQGKPLDKYYACGWMVRPTCDGGFNSWHRGSLPGTSTLLVRRSDGLNWAVLFNTRPGRDGTPLARKIDPRMHQAADAVKRWPKWNLYRRKKL
jgi:CubicO group peptidase (beta-lactamase class C family)